MPSISDLVQQTTVSTGTGNLTLQALNGRRSFSTAFGTGGSNVFFYFIAHTTAGEWEAGTGHLLDSTTLVRDTVTASSNGGSAVNFTAGTKDIVNDIPASYQQQLLTLSADLSGKQPLDGDLTALSALAGTGFVKRTGVDTYTLDANTYLTGNQTVTLSGDASGSGATSIFVTIANDAVTYAKIQNVSATDRLLGRSSAGAGDIEEITCTAFARSMLDDADASAVRTTLSAAAATHAHTAADISDFNEAAQDAVGGMIDGSLVYVDGTPLLQRAALTGDVTAAAGSNSTTIANDAVTFAKMQNIATDRLLGRATTGAGDVEEITCTSFARTILDDADASAVRTTLSAAAATHTHTAADISDFNEAAQDAVGNILTDSNTVDFTYNDAGNAITADVKTQMSVTSDASGLKLSGDATSPGNTKLYGTNGSGVKGWYDQPAGGGGSGISIGLSMALSTGAY